MNILKRQSLFFLIAILLCGSLCACGNDSFYIDFVKEGYPLSYPDKTYGEAFEDFFSSPKWEYFKGGTDDSDEEYDIVEFTGNCTYQDVEVEALIQFTLDTENDSFDVTYLSFNGVPQTTLVLSALIEAAFE